MRSGAANNVNRASRSGGARIVIVGGGFAGAFCAKALSKRLKGEAEIELVNRRNYFVFQPLLPEVASGVISAQDAVTPLRVMLPDVRHRQAEVKRIDFGNRRLEVLQGRRRILINVPYDELIITPGLVSDLSRFPGFSEHSLTMKDLSDAFIMRNHLLQCLEWADVTVNPEIKKMVLTFVVAGGGFSGVETVGELQDMVRRALRYYPNIRPEEVRFVLLQRGERILPELPASLSAYADKKLRARAIDIRLETGMAGATGTYVETDRGERIPTVSLITTIGNGPPSFVSDHFDLERGRIPVNDKLQVPGREHVWALGDAAAVPYEWDGETRVSPPTAQFAVAQANLLAANLRAVLSGDALQGFRFKPRGMLASLGAYQGVAEVFGVRLSGVVAWSIWRGFYMLRLPGFISRLRVALNWFLDYFVPRTIVEMQQPPHSAVSHARFNAGDVVFARGELLTGFFVVLSGRLEIHVPAKDGAAELVKTVGPQEHFGDRIRGWNTCCQGDVVAAEETRVMMVRGDDFVRLRGDFKFFDEYLAERYPEKYPEAFYPQERKAPRSSG